MWMMVGALVLAGCGAKDDPVDTSVAATGTGTGGSGTGTGTPGTLPALGNLFLEIEWAMGTPSPSGIVHGLVFDVPFDDPNAITAEPVGFGASPIDAGLASGDNMATYLITELPSDQTYYVLAFLDEDGTGGVDEPRPDEGDFVAMVGAGYPTVTFTVRDETVVAEVNTAIP